MCQRVSWMFNLIYSFEGCLLHGKEKVATPSLPILCFPSDQHAPQKQVLDWVYCEILLIYTLAGEDSHIFISVGGLCFCLDVHVYCPNRMGNKDSYNCDCFLYSSYSVDKTSFWSLTKNFKKDFVSYKEFLREANWEMTFFLFLLHNLYSFIIFSDILWISLLNNIISILISMVCFCLVLTFKDWTQ